MFEKLTPAERIALAKAKMDRVLDHFLYVIELHANNSFIVYSPTLASQIPTSFAANAFNVFQRSMHQIEIVRLCAIWDGADSDKENLPTVVELIDTEEIIEMLAEETRSHWVTAPAPHLMNPSNDPDIVPIEQETLELYKINVGNEQALKSQDRHDDGNL